MTATQRRKTCAYCPHLVSETTMGTTVYGCGKRRGAIVPQRATNEGAIFWRVPLECPLTSEEVHKSGIKIAHSEWERLPVVFERAPEHDRRIVNGDDFAGDAWRHCKTGLYRFTAPGVQIGRFDELEQGKWYMIKDGLLIEAPACFSLKQEFTAS